MATTHPTTRPTPPRPTLRRGAPLLLLAPLVLAAPARAQSGPWSDGELIVRSVVAGTQTAALYRIDPLTGHGASLLEGFTWGGWAGSLAFDPFRGGLIANLSLPPAPYWAEELWVIGADGSTTLIPGFYDQGLRALCPIGDGRIYFQRHTPVPSDQIEYLDAGGAVHVLLDPSGTAPLSMGVEHLHYDAATNALIGTTSGWWSPVDCVATKSSVWRVPLNADGSRAAGPVQCAVLNDAGNNVMGIDRLPDGDLLVTTAGAQYDDEVFLRVDPVTLADGVWGASSIDDIDGGVWSERLGAAVILDDWNNVLRAYAPGGSGAGTVIPTDVPVSSNTTGYSPHESLIELDVNGPACAGASWPLGPGLPGSGGLVPALAAAGCPEVGSTVTLTVTDALPGAVGLLLVGAASNPVPFAGGTLYPFPTLLDVPLVADGAGALSLPVALTNPATAGIGLSLQAGFLDPGAPQWIALTNGLWLAIG